MVCCFIGHRKIDNSELLEIKLHYVVQALIEKGVDVFLFGSKSKFNDLCYNVVTLLQAKYTYIKRIAYTCQSESCTLIADKEKWENLYEMFGKDKTSLFIVEKEVHLNNLNAGRASYIERNYNMINDSDICVFYLIKDYLPQKRKVSRYSVVFQQSNSGTKLAYKYAVKKNKSIILIN